MGWQAFFGQRYHFRAIDFPFLEEACQIFTKPYACDDASAKVRQFELVGAATVNILNQRIKSFVPGYVQFAAIGFNKSHRAFGRGDDTHSPNNWRGGACKSRRSREQGKVADQR